MREAEAVRKWNASVPIGSWVQVKLDDGSNTKTQTRSEAWVLGGHTAVILVDGISGCYLLSRCTPWGGDMSCMVKQSKRVVRVHEMVNGKPLCGNGAKCVRSWQEDIGPANCKACARIGRKNKQKVGA